MPGLEISERDRALINPKYICSSCTLLLKQPVQTLCGHFYCFSCVDDLKEPNRRDYRCIKDNKWFTKEEIFHDRCVQREVENLPIHCPRKDCPWRGVVAKLENHLSNCTFSAINEMPEKHTEKLGGCVYEIVGCKVPKTLTAEQLKEHNEKCSDFHLKLILNYVRDSSSAASLTKKIDNLNIEITEQARKIARLEEATKGLWGADAGALLRRVVHTENSTASLELLIVEMNTTVEQLNGKIDKLEKQREIDAKTITTLKDILGMNENPRNSIGLSGSHDQTLANDGILLWKITDFTRKRNAAVTGQKTSFCSPAFYSDRYGYKMCARIYLNGDGMGRGEYVSLFFVVMRGEYDALLRWPFRQKVTMMLLDQDHVEHVIDAFKPDPSSTSFKRPTSDMNIASGCPMFCPIQDLSKYAYIKDDTMFVKVIVDSSEIY